MGIVLEPVAPAGLPTVPVGDGLFGIGRDSEPFKELAAAAGLAVQQAYIFRERDGFHLMAIEGETTHNGHPLLSKQPVELTPGDEIGFAGTLRFRVATGTADTEPVALHVSLIPAEDSISNETIVLENLPFLVSRETVLFREYETTMPATVRALSRRHAFLYARDGNLYLKDLGSTNGTWVGDQRLEPYTEIRVYSGETLTFGSPLLSYTVQLERLDAEELTRTVELRAGAMGEATSGMHRIDKTVYIRNADSFLDIFLDQPADATEDAPAEPPKKPVGKLRAVASGLREALADDQPRPPRRRWIGPAVGALLLVLVGVYVLYDTPQQEVAALIEQERYRDALARAAVYRERYPDDSELEAQATEALARWLAPSWTQALDEGAFADADALLNEARAAGPLYPEGERLLTLLDWVVDLERFMAERGGGDAPLRAFRDEQYVTDLLARWDAEASGFELLMVKLARHVPAFQAQRARVSSRLRTLRNDRTVYLQALEQLRGDLDAHLAAGDTDAATLRVVQFERQYPRITGLASLREDMARLEQLQKAQQELDIDALSAAHPVVFDTPWVQEAATETLLPRLPSASTLEDYREALDTWRNGDADRAIALLRALSESPDAGYIAEPLAHFERVARVMSLLPSARQQADYGQRLMAFAQTLDRERDGHFLAALSDELSSQTKTLLAETETRLAQARTAWNAYRDAGGIDGLMRLEDTVSKAFQDQSQRLLDAYQAIEQVLQGHRLMHQPLPEAARRLRQEILAEVHMQRQSFSDLGLVMEPALLRDKLRLLPEPGES
jgi:hypothetical protein